MLLKHGCKIDYETNISSALANKEFKVVKLLIENGANPSKITLQSKDTPLHAATRIALEFNKGYSFLCILSIFIDIFKGYKLS